MKGKKTTKISTTTNATKRITAKELKKRKYERRKRYEKSGKVDFQNSKTKILRMKKGKEKGDAERKKGDERDWLGKKKKS